MVRADFVTSILVILLGLGAFVTSWRMPRYEHLQVDPYTVPGIVPGILSLVLLLLGIILLVRSVMRGGWRIEARGVASALFSATSGRLVVALVLTLGYAVGLVGRLPYWLATAVFMLLFVAAYEWPMHTTRRSRVISLASAVLLAIVVALAVTSVFEQVFLVRLP